MTSLGRPIDPVHHKHRKLLQPAFSPSHLRQIPQATKIVIDQLDALWKDQIEKQTSAHTLTFSLMELAQNPEIQETLHQEISNVDIENPNVYEALPHFKYLDQVLRESQRLHPVLSSTLRVPKQDVDILGYKIPKGVPIAINVIGIHRSTAYYTNTDQFDPSRWDKPLSNPNAFLPFGSGPHMCIGSKMAIIEIKVALILLLQRYKFKVPSEGMQLDFQTHITHSVKGLDLIIEPRSE